MHQISELKANTRTGPSNYVLLVAISRKPKLRSNLSLSHIVHELSYFPFGFPCRLRRSHAKAQEKYWYDKLLAEEENFRGQIQASSKSSTTKID